ncbi:hypothetical protein SmphiM12_323 [Sinorhizobium phage phiM12]|uniref:Uncharacterized protein n=1 Tax=Sinorhizobium phage phiM12 TaxID=1357423 RepID=S5MQ47_9CAUD|nr:hypothetical protein AB690_gp266 [Sinorhizobium phage phiM12]AGR47955.1 hypothetical protein SmphiM12_323 [Sinorhizobium phage phiM12]
MVQKICVVCGCEFDGRNVCSVTCSETCRLSRRRDNVKRWKEANPERHGAQKRRNREKNRQYYVEYCNRHYYNNIEGRLTQSRQYYVENRNDRLEYGQAKRIKNRIVRELIQFQFDTEELLNLVRKK